MSESTVVSSPVERIRSACAQLASTLCTLPDLDKAATATEQFVEGFESTLHNVVLARTAARTFGGVIEDIRAIAEGRETSREILANLFSTLGPIVSFADAFAQGQRGAPGARRRRPRSAPESA